MKVLDLFCGCGGFSYGFQRAGFDIIAGIDNWKGCKETFEYNHPNAEFILSDIRELDPSDFKGIDIVIGSPPCSEFSLAKGNKRDTNKGIELVNIFRDWVEIIKPNYWIMENVPQVKKFLDDSLYPIKEILNCADYGVPEIRRRCFSGEYIVPKRTHSALDSKNRWISVREAIGDLIDYFDNPNSDLKENKDIKNLEFTNSSQEVMKRRLNSGFGLHKRYSKFNLDLPSLTITDMHGDSPIIFMPNQKKYRRLSIRECARLQSFPDEFIFFGSLGRNYRMIGNAVPPLMSYKFAEAIKNSLK